jgi:hypothetical protein
MERRRRGRITVCAAAISWLPRGAATLVGSLPHRDRQAAISLVLEEMAEVPVWPQLSPYLPEQMMVQFAEGLPGLASRDGRTFFATTDSRFDEELLGFYEEYLAVTAGNIPLAQSRFRLGDESGRTFFAFVERLRRQQPAAYAVKGQVVGPFTLLAGLRDEHDRLALYDERLRDLVVKTLALKAQWQTERLRVLAPTVLISVDEPALAGFGSSAFISVSAAEVGALLREVASHIHAGGGLAGVHVCANTDWSLFFDSSLDFINFDAYAYFDRFALYRSSLVAFLDRGGLVAWGIVPTLDPEAISTESVDSLVHRWREQIARLVGPDLTLETILDSPPAAVAVHSANPWPNGWYISPGRSRPNCVTS